MIDPNPTSNNLESHNSKNPKNSLGLIIEGFLVILLILTAAIMAIFNADKIKAFFLSNRFSDFSTMQVTDGFHQVSIPNGNHWQINYEADHEVIFQGLVKNNYPIREKGFEIMTQDILITSGDFSNPDLVQTDVSDHHFSYRFLTDQLVVGTINLLHTLPMNEEINQQLQQVKPGDNVMIKGWEIYNLTGWDKEGKLLGTWQDAGCNTTLITQVVVIPGQ